MRLNYRIDDAMDGAYVLDKLSDWLREQHAEFERKDEQIAELESKLKAAQERIAELEAEAAA